MKKNILIWVVVIIVLAGLSAIAYQFYLQQPKPELNDFAKCVADKGWTMYGTYWCGHCQAEKAKYGSAFQYINYVECPDNIDLCEEKGIDGFPTWLGPNGARELGEVGLKRMAELSGCPLPGGY